MLEGNTYYFLRLEGQQTFYSISAAECTDVVIMNVGDAVTISYAPSDTGSILDAYSASWTDKPSNNNWQAPAGEDDESDGTGTGTDTDDIAEEA